MSLTVKCTSIMLLGFTATLGHADVTLKYDSQLNGEPHTVMVSGALVRTNSTNPQGKLMSIYDNNTKMLTLINDQQESYVVVDHAAIEEQAKRIYEQRERIMHDTQQQMHKMSPEQRKFMEQRLADMGMAGDESKQMPFRFSTEKTNRSEIVNGIRCEVYESFRNKEKLGEACIANPSALKISSSDYQTLQGLFAFLRSMTKRFVSGSPGAGADISLFDNIEGLPVKMANIQGETMILTDIANQALPPELFVIPSGYKLTEWPHASAASGAIKNSIHKPKSGAPVNTTGSGDAYDHSPEGYHEPLDQRGYGGPYPSQGPSGYRRY